MGRIQHSMLKTNISKTSKNLLGIVFFFAPFFISFMKFSLQFPLNCVCLTMQGYFTQNKFYHQFNSSFFLSYVRYEK